MVRGGLRSEAQRHGAMQLTAAFKRCQTTLMRDQPLGCSIATYIKVVSVCDKAAQQTPGKSWHPALPQHLTSLLQLVPLSLTYARQPVCPT
jgi:hypothetical protein